MGFAKGVAYPLRGACFVYFEHRRLARYWVFPIIITIAAVIGVIYGAASYYDAIGNALWSFVPPEWGEGSGWLAGVLGVVRWIVEFLIGITLFLIGLVVVILLSSVIAAPFNDALSEAVECIVTGDEAPKFSFGHLVRDIGRTVRLELLKAGVYLMIVGPMLLASLFIPVLGQFVSVIGFLFTAIYLGVDYIDWPAARRDWSVRDRIAFTRGRLGAIVGFGMGVWVLLFIPLVNLFFMPAAVAGGTLLFLELQAGRETAR